MMHKITIGRLEFMWARWTCRTFHYSYAAGGWLRCWYIWRLRIGYNLRRRRQLEWEKQPTVTQHPTEERP